MATETPKSPLSRIRKSPSHFEVQRKAGERILKIDNTIFEAITKKQVLFGGPSVGDKTVKHSFYNEGSTKSKRSSGLIRSRFVLEQLLARRTDEVRSLSSKLEGFQKTEAELVSWLKDETSAVRKTVATRTTEAKRFDAEFEKGLKALRRIE